MNMIEWSHELSVGIAEIDQQHKRLIQMLNDLADAATKGKAREVAEKTLDEMVAYAGEHFRKEEQLMEQYGYPNLEGHIAAHRSFAKNVTEMREAQQSGNVMIGVKVLKYLSEWLNRHIKGTDKMYSAFLNEKGVH